MYLPHQKIAATARPIIGLLVAAFLFAPFASSAADYVGKAGYKGTVTAPSPAAVTMKPGEKFTYRVTIKNTGTVTWSNTGTRFVSAYTYFPKYRTSLFQDASWLHKDQPAKLVEKTVAPGKTGHIDIVLRAPTVAGSYQEGFWLAAENWTWIPGTQFTIPITVTGTVATTPAPIPPPTPVVTAGPLAGLVMAKSFSGTLLAKGGDTVKVTLGFKNTGSIIWQTRILRVRGTAIATTAVAFQDPSWPNDHEPSRIREPISPGVIAYFTFTLAAPAQRGDYTLPLKLVIDDKEVSGTDVDVPITVTEDAPQLPVQQIPYTTGLAEPNIRVGIWNPPGDVVVSNNGPFTLRDAADNLLATVPADTNVVLGYNRENRTVIATTSAGQFTSATLMRFVPTDPNALFRVPNFAGWDVGTLYENRFRGTLEINYYAPSDNVWLIEELPLEQYVRGIAETGNGSHHEFQKALIVAARTYAYFVHSIGGKYALFDVGPTGADQVYRAYGSETIRPNVVAAAEETKGIMVTYGNDIVVTPYYSRSDGRTRSWQEVWCCRVKPWLISVPAPHDVGKTLWGHGVGMSAEDALGWAKDGKPYDWILKYFYTGVDLKRIY